MKIAIFTDTFIPQINGVVVSTLNLAKGLADKGHKVFIICPQFKNNPKEFQYKNIKVIRLKSIPTFICQDFRLTPIYKKKIFAFLKKEQIDIVHFHTPISLGIHAILISKKLKIPVIGTFHTIIADQEYLKNIHLNYKFMEKFSWFCLRKYYNKCNLITTPTNEIETELKKRGFEQNIISISNGIDLNCFCDNNIGKIRKKLLGKDENLLLYVGRISIEKNLFYLLDCFKLALKKVPKTRLAMVGGGPILNNLKTYAKKLGINDKVVFIGTIPHAELMNCGIHKASDVFVTSSTSETQSITILEAQVNGLPCIAVDEKGVKDVIKNDFNGFLIENNNKQKFADAIVKLLSSKNLYNKIRENTLKKIKNHDLKKVIETWEETYFNLLKNKTPLLLHKNS